MHGVGKSLIRTATDGRVGELKPPKPLSRGQGSEELLGFAEALGTAREDEHISLAEDGIPMRNDDFILVLSPDTEDERTSGQMDLAERLVNERGVVEGGVGQVELVAFVDEHAKRLRVMESAFETEGHGDGGLNHLHLQLL